MTEENYTTEFCMPVNIVPLSSEYEQAMAWAFGWNLSPNRHGLMYDIREHRVVFPSHDHLQRQQHLYNPPQQLPPYHNRERMATYYFHIVST